MKSKNTSELVVILYDAYVTRTLRRAPRSQKVILGTFDYVETGDGYVALGKGKKIFLLERVYDGSVKYDGFRYHKWSATSTGSLIHEEFDLLKSRKS